MAVFSLFKRSAQELKSIRSITVTGILVALYIVLEVFCSIDTGYFKINFAFLALAAIGMLFGPSAAMLAAIPCDIIAASVRGYAINPIFTLIAVFEGLIYGLILYGYEPKKDMKQIVRLASARISVVVLCNMVCNTFFTYYFTLLLSGLPYSTKYGFWEYFFIRLGKNALELPVDIVLMFAVLLPINVAYKRVIKQTT